MQHLNVRLIEVSTVSPIAVFVDKHVTDLVI